MENRVKAGEKTELTMRQGKHAVAAITAAAAAVTSTGGVNWQTIDGPTNFIIQQTRHTYISRSIASIQNLKSASRKISNLTNQYSNFAERFVCRSMHCDRPESFFNRQP